MEMVKQRGKLNETKNMSPGENQIVSGAIKFKVGLADVSVT